MRYSGRWYEVSFEDGVTLNTPAFSEEDARKKAPTYHNGVVAQVKAIGSVKKDEDFKSF